jgi:hypothetical protein
MCSEFILALVYFFTIFVVNFFLYKLLRSYVKNIFYFWKMRNIFKLFNKSNNALVSLFYLFFKKEKQNSKYLVTLPQFLKTKDILIVGNTYNYLSTTFQEDTNSYYFQLLKNQYLAKNIPPNKTTV